MLLERVPYRAGLTNPATSAENAFEIGGGVCQDHTHIFISAARLLGYPARYISGYLLTGDRLEQNATHAWAEVFLQSLGWVGFDVSNGISPSEAYVPIAVGLDYCDAAPVSGINYDGRAPPERPAGEKGEGCSEIGGKGLIDTCTRGVALFFEQQK